MRPRDILPAWIEVRCFLILIGGAATLTACTLSGRLREELLMPPEELSKPKTLLIYYGVPSAINGSTSIEGAANELGRYDFLILGDGLQDRGLSIAPVDYCRGIVVWQVHPQLPAS